MRTLGRSRAAALLEPCVTHGRGVRCDAEPFQRSLAAPYACLNARLGAATAASREAAALRSAAGPVCLATGSRRVARGPRSQTADKQLTVRGDHLHLLAYPTQCAAPSRSAVLWHVH
jgi:hypothetical protein